jgi:sugar lactone lactonase YvrE
MPRVICRSAFSRIAFLFATLLALLPLAQAETYDFVRKWPDSPPRIFEDMCDLATDPAGNMYILLSDACLVEKVSPDGQLIASWGGYGNGPGQFAPDSAMARDTNGNIYVASYRQVEKFDSNGHFLTQWEVGLESEGEFCCTFVDVATDAFNNVYVTFSGSRHFRKFSSSGALLSEFDAGDSMFPYSIAVDGGGIVYVTDGDVIRKFGTNGSLLASWDNLGLQSYTHDYPVDLATDSVGNVYFSNCYTNNVQKYDSNGNRIFDWKYDDSHDPALAYPVDVSVTPAGEIYLLDTDTIHKLNGSRALLATWGGEEMKDGLFSSPDGVATDSTGNVYVVDRAYCRIQKFDAAGTFLTKWGSGGSGDGQFYYPSDVTVDGSGHVYVADTSNHRIQKFDSNGVFVAKWGSEGTGDGQFDGVCGVAVDASGYVYALDATRSRVQKFDSNGVFIAKWGSEGTGDGQFSYPLGIAVDGSGNVYVVDSENNNLQVFDSNGVFLRKWGTQGSQDGQFDCPVDVAVDALERVYVLDQSNSRVQKFDAHGTFLGKWGNRGMGRGRFRVPRGLAVHGADAVYVTEPDQNRVQKFDPSGNFLLRWGRPEPGQEPYLNAEKVSTDRMGGVYVFDWTNFCIQKYDRHGNFLTYFDALNVGDPSFAYPVEFAADASGNLYVGELSTHAIFKLDGNGSFVAKWGSKGTGDGQFTSISDIVVDSSDNVFVLDSTNSRVQKFDANGVFLTKWGVKGTGDGEFQYPSDMAVDDSGNLYVVDTGNNRIQKFNGNGLFLAIWGGDATGDGELAGPGCVAVDPWGSVFVLDDYCVKKFYASGGLLAKWGSAGLEDGKFVSLAGIAADEWGNIYVSDTGNGRVQMFRPHPEAPVILTHSGQSYSTNNAALVLNGTCSPGAAEVRINGSATGVTFSTQTLAWSYSVTLAEGPNAFLVESIDPDAQVTGSASITVTLDTSLPEPPQVTGTSPTNNRKPTWTWTSGGGVGAYRYVLDNPAGTWTETTGTSFTPASNLEEGSHVLYVQERDALDRWSASGEFTIEVDLTLPPMPLVTTDGGLGAGKDFPTDSATLSLDGTADASAVSVRVNGSTQGVTLNSATHTWSYTGPLAYGDNMLYVTVLEASGNSSSAAIVHVRRLHAPDIYVTMQGNDTTGEGTLEKPWQTIGKAMAFAAPAPLFDRTYTVHAGPGAFFEEVTFQPHVRLIGAGTDATTITTDIGDNAAHVLLRGADDTALSDCRLAFVGNSGSAANYLLVVENVDMSVTRVDLQGGGNFATVGATVTGEGSSASVIEDCNFTELESAIWSSDSAVSIIRSGFDTILGDAIYVDTTAAVTPRFGVQSEILTTGLNRFHNVAGYNIRNNGSAQIRAQYNDWGVYTANGVAAKLSGPVQYAPYIGLAIDPGTVVVELFSADTQQPLPLSATCSVALSDLSVEGTRDAVSGLFLIKNLAAGAANLRAGGMGYAVQTAVATVDSERIVPLEMVLNTQAVVLTGDVNNSGKVDALDVQLVINSALGRPVAVPCDLNRDGKVNALDVQAVIVACLRS